MSWLVSCAMASMLAWAADPPPIQRPAGLEPAVPMWSAPPPQPLPTTTTPAPAAPVDAPQPPASADPPSIAAPAPAPTTAPAPDAPRSSTTTAASANRPEAAPHRAGALRRERGHEARFPHRGAIFEANIGTMGCVRALCGDSRHAISPGVRLGGFIGGNIRGWVEIGVAGGWGSMRSRAAAGTNAMSMYGLDPGLMQQALNAQSGGLLQVDFYGLATDEAKMTSTNVGPLLRVHFIPRGRVAAWAGSGVGYHLLRNRYETLAGRVKMDFHGLAVPIEAGMGVFVHDNVALTAQFDYLWTWYGLAVLDHPDQRSAIPVSLLQAAGDLQGVDISGELPQFWTVGFGIRGRI